MIALVWRFDVRAQHREAFEAAYGPEGDWARLFARGEGFRGTELLRGGDGAYLTIDRWRSAEDFDAFIAAHRADYEALDRTMRDWTLAEERIGAFELL